MKVLLTGGAGYIGSHTAVELLENNHEIVIVDNFSNSSVEVLEKIKKISKKDFSFYEVDVCNKAELFKVFEKERIDAVIHFAGYKAVGESVKLPLMYYKNNMESTFVLLEAMEKYNVNRIIFSSSATVYGTPKSVPVKETEKTGDTTNPYATTKYMIEKILEDYQKANPKFSVAILRYFNPIGAHESALIGELPNGTPNNLMPYITQVASGKLEQLNVFGDDYETADGTGVRDYIHVCDLAHGHFCALEKIKANVGYFTYNLGTGIGYSVLDIVKTFEKVNNIKLPYKITNRRAGDIATCYADPSYSLKELNFKTKYTLEDMCRTSWNFEKNINK